MCVCVCALVPPTSIASSEQPAESPNKLIDEQEEEVADSWVREVAGLQPGSPLRTRCSGGSVWGEFVGGVCGGSHCLTVVGGAVCPLYYSPVTHVVM